MLLHVNEEQLNEQIKTRSIVFVDFWAKWCAPCKAFEKIYEKVASNYSDISFCQVNTEEYPNLAQIFEIQSIPHLLIFKNEMIIYSESGSMPESLLRELAEQARLIDMDKMSAKE